MEERPRWQKVVAAVVAIVILTSIVVFWHRFKSDFWPLDRSTVGPNIVASLVTYLTMFVAAVLVYPPWRRAAHRFFDRRFDELKDHITFHHKRREAHDMWAAKSIRTIHLHLMDEEPKEHPHFDLKK